MHAEARSSGTHSRFEHGKTALSNGLAVNSFSFNCLEYRNAERLALHELLRHSYIELYFGIERLYESHE